MVTSKHFILLHLKYNLILKQDRLMIPFYIFIQHNQRFGSFSNLAHLEEEGKKQVKMMFALAELHFKL